MIKTSFAKRKITGGKFLRIDVTFEEKIDEIKITGDFFLHPENTLDAIENEIRDLYVPINKPSLIDRLNRIIEKKKADLIGISTIDIVNVLGECLQ